ncbi:hypothetical protein [Streptomyces lavendulae]|uniref:hypothetical protein n=1 Tax=Streptomyces lavendulae TaxID=1914 RepID=UPI003821A2B3
MLELINQTVPLVMGSISFVALASNPVAPCGPEAQKQAETIREHLRAVANHARAIMVLIIRKTGATGTN